MGFLETRTGPPSRKPSMFPSHPVNFFYLLFLLHSRKAAKHAHPDKGGSEAKMATLNEAYEVLSSPELRARFDAGDDPNDPMSQQGGHPFASGFGGHPFASFFQQNGGGQGFPGGQGGPFQFHFSHQGR